eukprot:UN13474
MAVSKLIVFGYIHLNERELQLNPLGELVEFACLSFYIPQHFEYAATGNNWPVNPHISVWHKRLTCSSAYGKLLIDPTVKGTLRWKFRITGTSYANQIKIGIASGAVPYYPDFGNHIVFNTVNPYYLYCQDGRKYSHKRKDGMPYIGSFNVGDIVQMKLNFNDSYGKLYFKRQSSYTWVCAFSTIFKTTAFRMAASWYGNSTMEPLEILDTK